MVVFQQWSMGHLSTNRFDQLDQPSYDQFPQTLCSYQSDKRTTPMPSFL